MPPPRLLVFDLDGTLIDSSLDLCNSVNAMLAHLGRPQLPNAVIASYVGDGAALLVRRALGDPGDLDAPQPDDSLVHTALDYFIRYYHLHKLDNTTLYPGVLESLTTLRHAHPGLLMAVLTNKPVNPSRGICDALGLTPFLFQNYGGNSFASKKPDPEGLLALIAEASQLLAPQPALQPSEVVMIGDSGVDILTGRAIGARTLGCLFGLAPETLLAARPDATVTHAADWPRALGL